MLVAYMYMAVCVSVRYVRVRTWVDFYAPHLGLFDTVLVAMLILPARVTAQFFLKVCSVNCLKFVQHANTKSKVNN